MIYGYRLADVGFLGPLRTDSGLGDHVKGLEVQQTSFGIGPLLLHLMTDALATK